jgi:hypothetical protein
VSLKRFERQVRVGDAKVSGCALEMIAGEALRGVGGYTGATLTPQTFVRALRTIADPPSAVRDVVNVSGAAYTNLVANALREIPNYQ